MATHVPRSVRWCPVPALSTCVRSEALRDGRGVGVRVPAPARRVGDSTAWQRGGAFHAQRPRRVGVRSAATVRRVGARCAMTYPEAVRASRMERTTALPGGAVPDALGGRRDTNAAAAPPRGAPDREQVGSTGVQFDTARPLSSFHPHLPAPPHHPVGCRCVFAHTLQIHLGRSTLAPASFRRERGDSVPCRRRLRRWGLRVVP